MKILILLTLSLLLYTNSFAFEKTDTTFNNDLNNDGKTELISIKVNEEEGTYVLSVNDSKFFHLAESTSDLRATVVRINYAKYLMVMNMAYYGFETVLYEYDKKIDSIGQFWSLDIPVVEESGIIKVNNWMGFWSADYEYHMIDKKLIPMYKTEYTIPENVKENDIKTSASLFLRPEKSESSKSNIEIKPNTQIFIIKADIQYKCKSPDEWEDGCNWYYIKSKDDRTGWIMLKDFQDKVEGIPWAG
ncbi:MAG: hypothetical protein WC644_05470 [Ignavibacteria bacterium]